MKTNSTLYNYWKQNNFKNKNLYAIFILMITIILIFSFSYNIYANYIKLNQELSNFKSKKLSLTTELNFLNEKKVQVNNDKEIKKALSQFAWDYREDLILNQIYKNFDWIKVGNISLNKWQKLPNGLSMANITINLTAKNLTEFNKYLEYLTWESYNLRFIIKNVSFPFDSQNNNLSFQASINLGMYYFWNN